MFTCSRLSMDLQQVLVFQLRRSLATLAIPAIFCYPTPPPYVDPIRPQPTQFDPMLRDQAEGHSPKMEKPSLKPGVDLTILVWHCAFALGLVWLRAKG